MCKTIRSEICETSATYNDLKVDAVTWSNSIANIRVSEAWPVDKRLSVTHIIDSFHHCHNMTYISLYVLLCTLHGGWE